MRALARRAPARRRRRAAARAAPSSAACAATRDSGAVYLRGQVAGTGAARSWRCCARCWRSPGHAVAKERLFELVFPGEAEVQAEAIEVVAYRLRKKLAAHRRAAGHAARPGLPAEGRSAVTRHAPRRLSLRSQLLLGILLPVLAARRDQHRQPVPPGAARGRHRLRPHAAGLGQVDRRAARGRRQRRRRRALRATVPYSALEAFEADNRSRMFYKVSGFHGEMVSGFDDLPAWRGKLPDQGAYAALVDFYDDRYRGQPVRVAVLLQPVAGASGRGMATIQVAETLELRQTLARQILLDTLWRQAALVAVIALVVVCGGAARHAAGARAQRRSCARRGENDLAPIDAARRAARAAAAGRRHQPGDGAAGAPARPPEALRARHLAPAAHAAGGAEDAGAVGPARRRRAGAGAARDRATRSSAPPSWPTRCWRWPRSSSCASRATRRWSTGPRSVRAVALDLAPLIAEQQLDFDIDTVPRAGARARMGAARADAQPAAQRHQAQPPQGARWRVRLVADGSAGRADHRRQRPRHLAPSCASACSSPSPPATPRSGSGLGLAICHEIVQLAGRRASDSTTAASTAASPAWTPSSRLPLADNPALRMTRRTH